MNQEIFSPDDLDQFQFSPSDKKTSTQPIAAYASSLTESLKSLSIAKLKLLRREDHEVLTKNTQTIVSLLN